MKKIKILIFPITLFACILTLFTACSSQSKKYIIGVSQCSEDSWRTKLETELEQATYFNEDVELVICSANDNMELQCHQIDSLIDLNVDLLIISPQQVNKLSDAIKHATNANIPVILFDRKSDVKNYTAFMGADNYEIGKMLGEYAAAQLGRKGNIVEIGGEHGSSPAIERHNGFRDAIAKYPYLHIIGFEEGDWKETSGEKAMERILEKLEKTTLVGKTSIDCVFGGNDRMAIGARRALERYEQVHTPNRLSLRGSVGRLYLGIDALPTSGGGIEKVRDGILTASAIYPTHGDEVMQLALKILKGEPYEKINHMETSLVTKDNANVLLLQHEEIVNQHSYIKKMNTRVVKVLHDMNEERFMLLAFLGVIVILSIFTVVTIKINRTKHRLIEELQAKNDELNYEKETVERQRDELEEQRDELLDATTKDDSELALIEPSIYHTTDDEPQRNGFIERFLEILDKRLADSDLSVEDIGQELCLSRVQLYRKVKAITGRTPVEMIREERLKRGHILLQSSDLTISEIAFKVGFSAPSYFAKCYKNYYGKAPSEK